MFYSVEIPVSQNTVAIADECGFRASQEEDKRLQEIESLLIVEEGSSMSVCSGQTNQSILSIQVHIVVFS